MEQPGCRDKHGNFKQFLHIVYFQKDIDKKLHSAAASFVWPFATNTIDPDTLLAYYHATQYQGWPGHWDWFARNMEWFSRKPESHPKWFLAKGAHSTEFDRLNATAIPEEFLNAFTRSG